MYGMKHPRRPHIFFSIVDMYLGVLEIKAGASLPATNKVFFFL